KEGPNGTTLLTVRLRQPLREGTLAVDCLGPGPTPGPLPWTSPGLRLAGGVAAPAARGHADGETLVLKFPPDMRLDGWHPGGFRLTETAVETDPELGPLQRLTLKGGGLLPEGNAPHRPSARLLSQGAVFRARQAAWWQVGGPGGMALTLRIT